jgi:glycosyltransferase domain-containing protein
MKSDQSLQEKFTIFIPTKNRPDFILRLLKYYSSTGYRGHLFIGDSSEEEFLEKNRISVKKFEGDIQIYYQEFPGLGQGHTSAELVKKIETEFSSILPDDDIIVTSSIAPCIQYLIDHGDTSGASGKSILFDVDSNGAFGKVNGLTRYSLAEVLDSTGQAHLH